MTKGRRLVVWIPENDLWIFEALDELQRIAEQKGIPLSKVEIVRLLLKPELADRTERYGKEKPNSNM